MSCATSSNLKFVWRKKRRCRSLIREGDAGSPMFTSRMPIPYPPLGCKRAHIQNSRALVVPEGASLPPICVQCGNPSKVTIRATFHWPQPEPDPFQYSWRAGAWTVLVGEIGYLFRWVFRLDTRVTLQVPLCSGHHYEEKFWRWLGWAMTTIGLAVVVLNYTHFQSWPSRDDPVLFGTFVLLLGGSSLIFSGMSTLNVVEVNTAFSAYEGIGFEYIKKMPHEVQIFPPRFGAAFGTSSESDRHESGSAPIFSTDLL
jgi:hypothetical protein